MKYRVLVFDGVDLEALVDVYSPALTFYDLSWDEAPPLVCAGIRRGYLADSGGREQ